MEKEINVTQQFLEKEGLTKPIPKILKKFERELELIKNHELNTFFHNSLLSAPERFKKDEDLLNLTKKAYVLLHNNLTLSGVQGEARDAVLGLCLVSKIMKHEIPTKYKGVYPLLMDTFFRENGLHKDIPQGLYQNILKELAGTLGHESALPELEGKPGSLGHEIYTAYKMAGIEQLSIDTDAYYDSL